MVKDIILLLVLLLTIAITAYGVRYYYIRKIDLLIESNKWVVTENCERVRAKAYNEGHEDGVNEEKLRWLDKLPDSWS